ncbi:MAG: hypothetical protein J5846_02055 [Desulfovibrio sp.]|nr:hypothetical protein [Desulfovibrio sp.]
MNRNVTASAVPPGLHWSHAPGRSRGKKREKEQMLEKFSLVARLARGRIIGQMLTLARASPAISSEFSGMAWQRS